jgi:hypothetical protein
LAELAIPALEWLRTAALAVLVSCVAPREQPTHARIEVPSMTTADAAVSATGIGTADASEPLPAAAVPDARPVASDVSAPPVSTADAVPPEVEDAWIGMTAEEVKACLNGSKGARVRLSGPATVTVRGTTWFVEWEPRGCSDWTWLLVLHFERGRVGRADERGHYRYTGKECW